MSYYMVLSLLRDISPLSIMTTMSGGSKTMERETLVFINELLDLSHNCGDS